MSFFFNAQRSHSRTILAILANTATHGLTRTLNVENLMRGRNDQIYYPNCARAHTSFRALPPLENALKNR